MKNYILTFLFSALSLLATAQAFDDNFFNNFEKNYQKDPVQFLKSDNTPDFTIVYGNGRLGDKESVLKIYEALNQVSRTVTELKTRQLGNTGIATGILNHTYTSKQNGSPINYTNRFTHTFALQKGKWHLVAVHFTDMPPMPPFTEQTLLDMNKRLMQDFPKFISEEVSPEYSFITAAGAVLSYQSMKDAKIKIVEWNTHDLTIKQVGNVAIVRGINDHSVQSTTSNELSKYSVHFIYTFEYKKDKWLWLTAHHIYNNPNQNQGQTIQKGNLVGIRNMTVELKPNVTMEQVIDFYNTRWIPNADKYFGWHFSVGKCLRGTDCADNKLRLIAHFKTEAERDKYFKMAEGGKDLNELGAKAWAQFAPTDNALKQLATIKDDWADWLIK